MMTDATRPIAVRSSTPRADAVADFVAARYGLPGPLDCTFLRRGFNDTYELRAQDSQRVVLRISGWRLRGEADVGSETAFLVYLDGAGIPVSAVVPTPDGALSVRVPLPEGSRPAVTFRYVEGRVPDGSAGDARAQGITLARMHAAVQGFAGWNHGRYRLDLDHLMHRPVAAILALNILDAEKQAALTDAAARLAAAVAALVGLTWTRCHGDCHGLNARIATVGPKAGQAIFFDFDDGGPGYLAYDLAVFLWAQVSLGRTGHASWHAFIEGYRSVRPITSLDYEAARLFVPIRHIWLMGEYASKTGEWGSEGVPAAWLAKQVEFIRSWTDEMLSDRLL